MRRILAASAAALVLFAGLGLAVWRARSGSAEGSVEGCLNPFILAQMDRYDWSYTQMPQRQVATELGLTHDISYLGQPVFQGNSTRQTYCIALMFEVYLSACQAWALGALQSDQYRLDGIAPDGMGAFRRDFYGTDGDRTTLTSALVDNSLGRRIGDLDEARPGDLLQFWRFDGSGHSGVFLSWQRNEEGRRSYLEYWSAQDGRVGAKAERIGTRTRDINESEIYVVRPYLPTPPEG